MSRPVPVRGPLDAEHADDVRPLLHSAAAAASPDLDLDLAAVPSIDPTGLGLLVGARQRVRQRGGELRIVNVSPEVAGPISRAGLWALLAGGAPRPQARSA